MSYYTEMKPNPTEAESHSKTIALLEIEVK